MSSINVHKKALGTGFKRTPQRLAILAYLDGNSSHPSAEDIYRAVSKKYQSLSLATVYNTLNTLAQSGAVRELTIDPQRKRYDPDTSHHHHLICITCGKIADVAWDIAVDLPKGMTRDFVIVGNHVEFYGHCAACGKKH
jgi:Fur family transcriptional regulator, peroxide stress response regulator